MDRLVPLPDTAGKDGRWLHEPHPDADRSLWDSANLNKWTRTGCGPLPRLVTAAIQQLSGPGTALERISAYLRRERDVLKGCPVGRLTQDPDVMAAPVLRKPVEETFTWLRDRLATVVTEGVDAGELRPAIDPVATASAIVAALQGGYVLARAADSAQPFDQAIEGILALLGGLAVG